MERAQQQARIDAVTWYHEFDFGNGLQARSKTADVVGHRIVWRFMEAQMDQIDFRNKSVLDIGCWDGYWSFYAERRGAKRVLATDDCTQNWADGRGLLLAKELYGSAIDVNQRLSVYQLASLGQQFDIILFLGVYYHLLDPFYALAQIRHCCHRDTLVLMEGNEALALGPNEAVFNFPYRGCEFLPTFGALEQLLQATYFRIAAAAHQPITDVSPPPPCASPADPPQAGRLGWRWRLRLCAQTLRGSRPDIRQLVQQIEPPPPAPPPPPPQLWNRRVFLTCAPFEGIVSLHEYPPPFQLREYDPRFRQAA